MSDGPTLLVVDDTPENIKLLDAILSPRGYVVVPASSGEEALAIAGHAPPDLVLLDVVMPGLDGYEVCRRLRDDAATRLLPVVMVTASGDHEKVRAIEAGADDFIQKPLDQAELLARVRSLLRIKRFQDELAELNRTLEARVAQQVADLERFGRLTRFLSPQVAELVVAEGEAKLLETHRSEIAAVFCDLRGFTPFAETVEPEEVIEVLRGYHQVVAKLVSLFEATLDHIAGDGILTYFNDPVPCDDAPLRAVRMAVAMRDDIGRLAESWRRRGHDLDVGIGVSLGYATLGTIGSEGLFHYASIGSVTNLAARLSDEARGGQILASARIHAAVEDAVECEPLGAVTLKGFARPVEVFDVIAVRPDTAA